MIFTACVRRIVNARKTIAAAPAVLAVLLSVQNLALAQDNQTARSPEQLERYLQRFPEADANRDGVLTLEEVNVHLEKRRGQGQRVNQPSATPQASRAQRRQERSQKLLSNIPIQNKFDYPVQFDWATMSDGVKIAVSAGFPKGYDPKSEKKWPAVFRFAGRTGSTFPDTPSTFDNQYVMVNATVRGTGASGGRLDPMSWRTAQDGYEIIEHWIVQQPWSNGKVGMNGNSWGGITTFMVASSNPPSLKAICVSGSSDDLYRGVMRIGGIRNSNGLANWAINCYRHPGGPWRADTFAQQVRNMSDDQFAEILASRPQRDYSKDTLWTFLHEPHDGPAWEEISPNRKAGQVRAPMLLIHSYQDEGSGPSGCWLWKQIPDDVPKRLVLTNGRHETQTHFQFERKAWLAYWLLGRQSNDIADPNRRVQIYFETTGTNAQGPVRHNSPLAASDYPLPLTQWTRLYLNENDKLSTQPPTARRSQADQYQVAVGPPDDQIDALRYTYDLEKPTAIAGPMTMTLWAEISNLDTDFFVIVGDLDPDGNLHYIQRGMLRASHRALDKERSVWIEVEGHKHLIRPHHSHSDSQPVPPNKPHEYQIEIFPAGHVFRPGHKLVVQISQPPYSDPVVEKEGGEEYTYVSQQARGTVTILRNQAHPSSILLPILRQLPPISKEAPSPGTITGINYVPFGQ